VSRSNPDLVPVGIAVVAGVLSWDLVRLISKRPEVWLEPKYYYIGYPLMLVAAFMLGLGFPERPWRWALVIIGAQGLWATFLQFVAGSAPNLLSLVVICAVLGLPCVVSAYVGQWLRSRLPE